jgi:spore germination protein GerM
MNARGLARGAFVLGLVVTGVGCGVPDQGRFIPIDDASLPPAFSATTVAPVVSTIPEPDVSPSTTLNEILYEDVELYFVSANRVVRSERRVVSPATPTQILDTLLAGLDSSTESAGLRSALPRSASATIEVRRGVARISAAAPFLSELEPVDQRLAIAQIVLTLTRRPGIGQVVFVVDGQEIQVPRGAGDLVAAGTPVTFDDYLSVLSSSD